jgi:hypothetical protein
MSGSHAVDSRGVRRRMWTGRGGLEPADVAVELCLGDPAAAADVDGAQIPALHKRVHRGAADAEDLRRLLGREEKPTGGHDVSEWLRITHVEISRISCCLWWLPYDGGGAACRTSPVCLQPRIAAVAVGDWRLERRPRANWRTSGASSSADVEGAGEVGASPVGLQYGLSSPSQGGQVPVVDPPVVQLAGELAE